MPIWDTTGQCRSVKVLLVISAWIAGIQGQGCEVHAPFLDMDADMAAKLNGIAPITWGQEALL